MPSPKQPRTAASRAPAEAPKSTRLTPTPIRGEPDEAQMQDEIRRRAYDLWQQRGQRDGFAEEDWLEAEKEVLARYGRAA